MTRQRGKCLGAILLAGALSWGRSAIAEVTLVKTDGGFEFFSTGRVGGFLEGVKGQTLPTGYDQSGMLLHTVGDGGLDIGGLYSSLPNGAIGQGTVQATRVRSGFLGNILSFGARRDLTETVTTKAVISIWANIESENRRSFVNALPDVREGYLRSAAPRAASWWAGR